MPSEPMWNSPGSRTTRRGGTGTCLADNDDPAGELTAAVPLSDVALPDDATLCRELADPYPLTPEHVATFRNNGFIMRKFCRPARFCGCALR